MSRSASTFTLAVSCLLLCACAEDNFATVVKGQLVVEPDSLTFPVPAAGQSFSEAEVTLRNAGGGPIQVRSVTLTEDDDTKEVSLLDGDDLRSGAITLEPEGFIFVRLRWTVADAQVDRGTISIDTNAGNTTVPFETADIDPAFEITSDPVGDLSDNGLVVEILDALAGQVRPVSMTLRGVSFAPLSIEGLCLLDDAGQCIPGNTTDRGDFSLCEGRVDGLGGCERPDQARTLQFQDTADLTLIYRPAPDATNTTSARVQITSNAARAPQFIVTVRGTPCPPEGNGCEGAGVPRAIIEAPTAGAGLVAGSDIDFVGLVSDDEDSPSALSVRWESDAAGVLDIDAAPDDAGRLQGTAQLEEGQHLISLHVEDSAGNIGVDTVLINVGPPNAPPSAPSVSIEPDPATTLDDLRATAEGSVDPEGDPVELRFVWLLSGEPTEYTGDTVPSSATQKGQVWTVEVTPSDSVLDGPPGTATLTISNSPPTIDTAFISPETVFPTTEVTCTATASDADGEDPELTYEWYVGERLIGLGGTFGLTAEIISPGDELSCVVTTTDTDGGASSLTVSVLISRALSSECRGGAVREAIAPGGDMVVCDHPDDLVCEQDFETLCPTDWHLCTMDEYNARNEGWTEPTTRERPALGVIFCRTPTDGAGHFTVPDSGSGIVSLGVDEDFNCYFGSSRASCTAGYGCNEQRARALCCAPQPNCGNGEVDHPEEQCDDGNDDDGDECLSVCAWRVPTAHGFTGTNCQ